jgi:hypothetical protein
VTIDRTPHIRPRLYRLDSVPGIALKYFPKRVEEVGQGARGLDVLSTGAVVVVYDLGVDIVLEHFQELLAEYETLHGGNTLDT